MTRALPCDAFQRRAGKKREGGLVMKIGLSGFMKLQCLVLFESQTKEKREGRTREMKIFTICQGKRLPVDQTDLIHRAGMEDEETPDQTHLIHRARKRENREISAKTLSPKTLNNTSTSLSNFSHFLRWPSTRFYSAHQTTNVGSGQILSRV